MTCCGQHRKGGGKADYPTSKEHYIVPTEPCALCAEKHISTAYALAQECGYAPVNRQRIVGELVACQWHLFKDHANLAELVRGIRHCVQRRREAEVDWHPILTAVDFIAAKEAEKQEIEK
jgi:hypothetical protein